MTNKKKSAGKAKLAQRPSQEGAGHSYKDATDAQQVLEKSFTKTALGFLNVEVDTGLNLARIAARTYDDEQSARNRVKARQAYDTVLKHLGSVDHAGSETLDALHVKIAELRELLIALGEQM